MAPVTHLPESGSIAEFVSVLDQFLEENCSSESLPNEQECENEGELDTECPRTNKRTSELISETVECEHPSFFGGLCVQCGQNSNGKSAVEIEYMRKKSKFSKDDIASIWERNTRSLLQQKKLYLVLDLDHTLVNTVAVKDLSGFENYLRNQTDTLQDLFVLKAVDKTMAKLRPFVHTFLKVASTMFDLHLFTTGSQAYALEMAKLLDPKLEYFNSKVISHEKGTEESRKFLMLMGREQFTVILADTVWSGCEDNLILISPYHFFYKSLQEYCPQGRSLAEARLDEEESRGALSYALDLLGWAHTAFFRRGGDLDFCERDVREVLSRAFMTDRLHPQTSRAKELVLKKT